MKKRIIVFICILMLVLASTCTAFAGGLEIVETSPEDGFKGAQPSNMAIKITFNDTMIGSPDSNKARFKIKNEAGELQKFTVVSSEKYPDQLWLVVDGTLAVDSTYTVDIGAGIKSANGNTTAETQTITFKTRNTKTDSLISTVLMFAMFGGIIVYSTISAKKKAAEEQPMTQAQLEKLNPYKIAKAKDISLEQAEEYIKKEKEKAKKAEEKAEELKRQKENMAAAELAKIEAEVDSEERRNGWFRVKAKGSFVEHGHEVPKAIKKKNAAKRKAAEERAKKYAKNKKKK